MKPTPHGSLFHSIESILAFVAQVRIKNRQIYVGFSLLLRFVSIIIFIVFRTQYPAIDLLDTILIDQGGFAFSTHTLFTQITTNPLPLTILSIGGLFVYLIFQISIVQTTVIKHYTFHSWRDDISKKMLPLLGTHFISNILVFLGLLLFIVPGIIFSVFRIFSPIITITTGIWGYSSCKMSKRLIDGNWRKMLLLILAFWVLINGLNYFIASTLSFIMTGYLESMQIVTLQYFFDVLFSCIQLVIYTSMYIYWTENISKKEVNIQTPSVN